MPAATTKPNVSPVQQRRGRPAARLLPYAVTALLALLFCGYLFDLPNQDLHIPLAGAAGDHLLTATILKGVMQHGWYTTNPMVGAPHHLDFHDFPMAEGLHFVFYQVAGLLRMGVVEAMNLHYILGYVLIALTSLYTFRAFHLPTAPAISASLLFAFLPHHWMRGQNHLMLSSYYMIPLTVLVILWVAGGEELIEPAPGRWFRYRLTGKGRAAAVISALTGSAGIYYAVYGMAFLAIMAAFRWFRRPGFLTLLSGMMPIAFIGSLLMLNMSPSLMYWMRHGTNNSVAARTPVEADIFGLKLVQLLMPIAGHRVPLLARWKADYTAAMNPHVPNNDLTATLGVVAGLGFLWLVGWLFFGQDDRSAEGGLLTHLSVLNMAAFLIGTIGGFGSLFAFTVSPQLRAGHRISVYIAYFSLMGVLILLRRAEILWIRRKRRRLIVQSIAAAVLFAGLWDITPSSLAISPTELATVKSDMNFIHAIEAAVPPGAMIYQLPYHPFPEYGFTNRMLDYDPLRGYVYSSRLRWSYGAMKGRPADEWQKQVASLPVEQMVVTVAQAGFQGISIDREGYRNPDELIGRLTALLGVPPVGSADRRFVFFPMMKYAAGINRGGGPNPEILQLPVGISWHGCYTEPGKNFWCPYDAVLELENANAAPRQVHLQAVFQSANGTPASLSFGPPLSRTIDIGVGQEPVSLDLAVPPGRLNIKLHSDAQRLTMTADTRLLVFSVTRLETRGASTVAEPRQPIAIALTECTPGSGTDNFWCPFDGTLELTNPGTEPRRISVSADIQTAANDPAVLTLGGLVTKTLAINHTGVPFTADVLLPPGKHSITLHCAGKRYIAPMDPRVLVFSLLKLAVTDQ